MTLNRTAPSFVAAAEAMSEALRARAAPGDWSADHPVLDLVVPVYNEAQVLAASVERLHAYLGARMPWTWRITVVDNASTDDTFAVAEALAQRLPHVYATHLPRKGRGLALRTAWSTSPAQVVAYTDVDLSTDLDALVPLIAPLVTGHSDLAIGSRLARGAATVRGPKRETVSRGYNLLLRATFGVRFRDAQCGFKAVRAEVARLVLPQVRDDGWFFDTELLLLAERNGLRVHEVPVDWVDDPDSRVDILATAIADLRGMGRLVRDFAAGRGIVDLGAARREPPPPDLARQVATFATIGGASTVLTLAVFAMLRPELGAVAANVLAYLLAAIGNTWANRRWTFRSRGAEGRSRHYAGGLAVNLAALGLTSGVLVLIAPMHPDRGLELAVLGATYLLTAVGRFLALRTVVFRRPAGAGARA